MIGHLFFLYLSLLAREAYASPPPAAPRAALERRHAEAMRLKAQWTGESLARAAALLRQVIAEARAAGAWEIAARSMEELDGYLGVTDPVERLAVAREAAALREALGDPVAAARNLVNVGYAQARLGDKPGAVATLQDALRRLQRHGAPGDPAAALTALGLVHCWMARYDEALEYSRRALALLDPGRDPLGTYETLMTLVKLEQSPRGVLSILRRAREVAGLMTEAQGGRRLQLETQVHMIPVHLGCGEFAQAEALMAQTLPAIESSRIPVVLPGMLMMRADWRRQRGEFGAALEDASRAVALFREAKQPFRAASALCGLGDLYADLGDWEQALAHHRRCLEGARRFGEERARSTASFRTAVDLLALARWSEAAPLLEAALAHVRKLGAPAAAVGWIRYHRALLQEGLGQPDAAVESLALALDGLGESPRAQAAAAVSLGRVHARSGRNALASRYLARALAQSRSMRDPAGEVEALHQIAVLERRRGRLFAARASIAAALEIVESLRGAVSSPMLRARFLASKQDHYALLIDTLLRLDAREPERGHAARALEARERARARGLLDTLRERRVNVREGVDPALLAREEELRRALDARAEILQSADAAPLAQAYALADALPVRAASPEARAAAAAELDALLAEYRELQGRIRTDSPRYAALVAPEPARAEAIQRDLLDGETVLLEYFLGGERSVVWLVTRDALRAFELPGRDAIEAAARRLYRLLGARAEPVAFETARERRRRVAEADRQLPAAARALSDMVLGPVAGRLAAKRLLVVADGALQYVPFAMLPLPGGGAPRPLLEEYELVHAPSASVLLELRREQAARPPASRRLAVFADPVFGGDDPRSAARGGAGPRGRAAYPRLAGAGLEARNLVRLAGADGTLSAVGFDARRAAAFSPELADYGIVHFATHAVVDDKRPELSGLVLSLEDEDGFPQDGVLRLHDVYNLKLGAGLVVLSACRTALGQEIRGEGLVGLTRGFMYAGAARVVASLWSSADAATAELMTRFYRHMLKDGLAPAAALRAAQLALSRSPERAAPYYWAGFILQGDWGRLPGETE